MNFKTIVLIVLTALLAVGCGAVNRNIHVEDGQTHDGDLKNVNGAIRIGRECRILGDVRNVNGSITVGEDSRVGAIKNTNGSVRVGSGTEAEQIKTTNGAIRIGANGIVSGTLASTNGSVEIEEGTMVGGDIETTNGGIVTAAGTRVEGKVITTNGRIRMVNTRSAGLVTANGSVELLEGTRIEGEMHIRKSRGTTNLNRLPKVIIGPGVVVEGPVRVEREVELLIHESAETGEITGAEAVRYSGDAP